MQTILLFILDFVFADACFSSSCHSFLKMFLVDNWACQFSLGRLKFLTHPKLSISMRCRIAFNSAVKFGDSEIAAIIEWVDAKGDVIRNDKKWESTFRKSDLLKDYTIKCLTSTYSCDLHVPFTPLINIIHIASFRINGSANQSLWSSFTLCLLLFNLWFNHPPILFSCFSSTSLSTNQLNHPFHQIFLFFPSKSIQRNLNPLKHILTMGEFCKTCQCLTFA